MSLDPQSLPARGSSLKTSRSRPQSSTSVSDSKHDSSTSNVNPVNPPPHQDERPPTPPPKTTLKPSLKPTSAVHPRESIPQQGQVENHPPKRSAWDSFLLGLISCCTPNKKAGEDDEDDESQIGRTHLSHRRRKDPIELDSIHKNNESIDQLPSSSPSTNGVHPSSSSSAPGDETAPPVPSKHRDAPTLPSILSTGGIGVPSVVLEKPAVTISPDAIPEKESAPRVITPPLQPVDHDDDDIDRGTNISTDDEREREKELRHSVQLQAPFPPTADELAQSDALVVSPSPQLSTTDSEESESEEIPRPLAQILEEGQPRGPFLGPVPETKKGRKCLVLDLDECLIHSTFADTKAYDFSIALNLEKDYGLSYIYVGKRPHLDEFLEEVGRLYEIVIFTASLQRYADPVVDIIDRNRVIDHRLFRDSCTRTWDPVQRIMLPNVKNISLLGRDLKQCIIIDNNPQCYQWHTQHAIPISSWFEDHLDVELLTMIPLLKDLASEDVEDVRDVLCQSFNSR